MGDKLAPTTRHAYTHEGRVVYEWDQTLDECNFYVRTPPGVKAKILDVEVTSTSVKFGIKGNPPYLHHELTEQVKAGDSLWTLEDGELHMQMKRPRTQVAELRESPAERLRLGVAAAAPHLGLSKSKSLDGDGEQKNMSSFTAQDSDTIVNSRNM